jgi:hypothetical protein
MAQKCLARHLFVDEFADQGDQPGSEVERR